MVKLSATIMAHRDRRAAVENLRLQLDRPVDVVWDTNRTPSSDPEQRWATGSRAWLKHDPDADWHVVLQDDILVCDDFLAGAEQALDELNGEGLVSFYTGTGRPDQRNVKRMLDHVRRHNHSWGSVRSLNWGPAICAPTHTIADMISWCSDPETKPQRPRSDNYDYRVGVYYRDILNWRTWYTFPSLVEHSGLPSLVGHDTGAKRQAHNFHAGSALDIDWAAHDGLNPTI